MSLTALAWIGIAAALVVASVRRPAYAVALYMLTFFAAPHYWWWGKDLPSLQYGELAGVFLLAAVLFSNAQSVSSTDRRIGLVHIAAVGLVLNATFVHVLLASNPSISDNYTDLLKFVLLFFLMWGGIHDRSDLRIVILAMAIGAGYIGYEITINERGHFSGSRLEGVGAPGADSSNTLASLLLMVLPLIGSLFVNGNNRHKITAIVTAPLALNVVIMCNSRGGFLALIGAGVAFLLLSPSRTRRQALKALALGGVVLYMLLGDPDIMNRFMTTFSGSEERDNSAASRIEFWKAGLLMLQDYPFGDGGGSFKRVRGAYYLAQVVGTDDVEDRSLHSGYLTEATEWGIQGLLIRLVFFGVAMVMAVRTSLRCSREGRTQDALMGTCFVAALISFLIGSIFGSFFSSEWSYWNVALLVRYGEIYRQPELALSAASVADRSKASRFEQASRAAAAAG